MNTRVAAVDDVLTNPAVLTQRTALIRGNIVGVIIRSHTKATGHPDDSKTVCEFLVCTNCNKAITPLIGGMWCIENGGYACVKPVFALPERRNTGSAGQSLLRSFRAKPRSEADANASAPPCCSEPLARTVSLEPPGLYGAHWTKTNAVGGFRVPPVLPARPAYC